jgi:hypothetical protein
MHADILQYNIDVAIISETWFNEKIDSHNTVSLDGYNLFRKDRLEKKCGGVCIYSKDSVTCEIIWPIVDSHPII